VRCFALIMGESGVDPIPCLGFGLRWVAGMSLGGGGAISVLRAGGFGAGAGLCFISAKGVGASSTPRLRDLDFGRWPRRRWRTVALEVLTGADADRLSADWLRLSGSGSSALAALHVLVRFGGGSRRKRRSAASCSSVAASGSSMRPRGEPRRTWKQQ